MKIPQTDLAVTDRPVRALVAGSGSPTRLLIIATDAPFLAAHQLSLASAARQAGYEVHVAAPVDQGTVPADEEALRAIREAGLAFHALPAQPENAGALSGYAMLRALARLIGALRPALVHCIGMSSVLYGGAIARVKGLAAVHAATGLGSAFMDEGRRARLHRFVLVRALVFACGNRRAYLTVGSVDERTMLSRFGVIDPKRTLLLHGVGVDLKRFHPRDDGEPSHEGPLVVMHAAPLTAAGACAGFRRCCTPDARQGHAPALRACGCARFRQIQSASRRWKFQSGWPKVRSNGGVIRAIGRLHSDERTFSVFPPLTTKLQTKCSSKLWRAGFPSWPRTAPVVARLCAMDEMGFSCRRRTRPRWTPRFCASPAMRSFGEPQVQEVARSLSPSSRSTGRSRQHLPFTV